MNYGLSGEALGYRSELKKLNSSNNFLKNSTTLYPMGERVPWKKQFYFSKMYDQKVLKFLHLSSSIPLAHLPLTSPSLFILSSRSCIEKRLVCDGRRDCNNQEDEDPKFCADYLCKGKFYCRSNNYCIHLSQKCDGSRDCSDGADEKDCPKRATQNLAFFDSFSKKRLDTRGRVYYDQTPEQVRWYWE